VEQSARYHGWSPLFVTIAAIFVTLLITSNVLATKLILVPVSLFEPAGLVLPAAIIIFPVGYIIGDILTEVYGYAAARRVIWLGFICNLLFVVAISIGGALPAAPFWSGQEAYETILGVAPRILAASFAAYLVGEFANSYVLARLKVATGGRFLWMRTIGSTVVGQGLDSIVFITLAFAGTPGIVLGSVIVTQWLVKTLYEVAATPLTYLVVGYLKRKEGIDTFDRATNFNPVAI
jgi:queuosine precursor transporter